MLREPVLDRRRCNRRLLDDWKQMLAQPAHDLGRRLPVPNGFVPLPAWRADANYAQSAGRACGAHKADMRDKA